MSWGGHLARPMIAVGERVNGTMSEGVSARGGTGRSDYTSGQEDGRVAPPFQKINNIIIILILPFPPDSGRPYYM